MSSPPTITDPPTGVADEPTGPADRPTRRRSGSDDETYGRLGVGLVALFIGAPLLALLLAWYVSLTGALPFVIRPGPLGVPPWAPFVILLGAIAIACAIPVLMGNLEGRPRTFWAQEATNKRNSVFLVVAVVGGIGLTAYVLGTVLTLSTSAGLIVATVAIAVAVVGAIVSYRVGDQVILRVSAARALPDGAEPVLHDVVQELSLAANVPPPRLYVIEDSAPNALTAGRDPAHAVLAVTSGLLAQMDREELQGVVAHELAHIRNYDSRYDLFVTVLVGTTVLIADGFFQVVTWPFRLPWRLFRAVADSGYSRGSRRVSGSGSGGSWSFPDIDLGDSGGSGGGGGKGGGLAILLAIVIFVVLVLVVSAIVYAIAPVFARLMQAAVSREREYLADAGAVELGRNPAALERALAKVASSEEVLEVANRATSPLYFVNPIRSFEKRASAIYSTHPSTADRIDRLRALQGLPPLSAEEAARFVEDID
jgi:heat shock protein HtpX